MAFLEEALFTCTVNGVDLSSPPYVTATVLEFRVGYLVETSLPREDYGADLEKALLGSALAGALQCIPGSPLFLPGSSPLPVPINTTISDDVCFPEVDVLNDCIIFESAFRVVVAETVDPEVARFLGYVEMQQDLDGDVIKGILSLDLDRIRYVSPLPLLPPLTNPEPTEPTPTLSTRNSDASLSVTPWTVSAVLAMCKLEARISAE